MPFAGRLPGLIRFGLFPDHAIEVGWTRLKLLTALFRRGLGLGGDTRGGRGAQGNGQRSGGDG
jgi:hypothetical protein